MITFIVLMSVVLFIIVFVIGPLIWHLSICPIHLESWAYYGSYLGGIIALFNLIVLLYISWFLKNIQENNVAKKRLTIDLYNEWHGYDLHKSRRRFSNFIKRSSSYALLSLSEFEEYDLRNDDGSSCSKDAFRIYHFLEKCAHLAEKNEVDTDLLLKMLRSYIAWYCESYFFSPNKNSETVTEIKETLALIEEQIYSKIKK